jgi:hypothetical protein
MAYTTIKKPSDYFNTKLYTGNASYGHSITGVGFQPDLVWIKRRDGASADHELYDAVRGTDKRIRSNLTNVEATGVNLLHSFDSDGFTLDDHGYINSANNFASWNWLANGAGSANTDGSISSTVSANTTSGFSIVSYTGTGANATVGHGLGVAPKMVIIKNRDSATNWLVYHASLGNANSLVLNTTGASFSSGDWQNTTPSSSSIYLSGGDAINKSSSNQIAYCFAEKQGYSKFGSYTGNGNADGTFVYTGFKPSWILVKSSSAGSTGWNILDNKRDPENVMDTILQPNNSNADANDANKYCDFLSNGFKWRASGGETNGSGTTYIYMAFAEQPLVGDNPATAR